MLYSHSLTHSRLTAPLTTQQTVWVGMSHFCLHLTRRKDGISQDQMSAMPCFLVCNSFIARNAFIFAFFTFVISGHDLVHWYSVWGVDRTLHFTTGLGRHNKLTYSSQSKEKLTLKMFFIAASITPG